MSSKKSTPKEGNPKAGADPAVMTEARAAVPETSTDLDLTPRRTLLVQLAVQLVTSQLAALEKGKSALPIDHRSYDDLFNAALRRADRMIGSHALSDSIIYAEQLFPPTDEVFSESKIGDEFKKWKWPQLQSRQSFLALMTEIAEWFARRLEKLEDSMSAQFGPAGVKELRFLNALFRFCGRWTGVPLEGPWPEGIDSLVKRITNLVEEITQEGSSPDGVRYVRARELAIERELLRLCFGGRLPARRESEPEGLYRTYRPWGVFRYLRHVGRDDPSAESLLGKLRVTRPEISPDYEPSPVVKADERINYDLGMLEELAEQIYAREYAEPEERHDQKD